MQLDHSTRWYPAEDDFGQTRRFHGPKARAEFLPWPESSLAWPKACFLRSDLGAGDGAYRQKRNAGLDLLLRGQSHRVHGQDLGRNPSPRPNSSPAWPAELVAQDKDFKNVTSCQRSGSGNRLQEGIPFLRLPLRNSHSSSPGVALLSRPECKLGRLPLPSAFAPWHEAQFC